MHNAYIGPAKSQTIAIFLTCLKEMFGFPLFNLELYLINSQPDIPCQQGLLLCQCQHRLTLA